jgi:diguanylate cyclase (GGDEF)-like protein
VLLIERVPSAVAAGLERSRPRRFAVERAASCADALAVLARGQTDAVLADAAALAPAAVRQLQRLTAVAADAALVVLARATGPTPQQWVEAGVHETVPRSCVLSPCGAGVDLLRRALLYAWEHKRAEARLADLALRDQLTGLPNRRALDGMLAGACARARRHRMPLAVLFLDLDGFKEINDRLGHAAGDQVLREVAARLRTALRASDLVARIGGDEFLAVVEDLGCARDADVVADKLCLAIARPIALGGTTVRCTASVGVAVDAVGRRGPDALIADADAAMYERKRSRRASRRAAAAAPVALNQA